MSSTAVACLMEAFSARDFLPLQPAIKMVLNEITRADVNHDLLMVILVVPEFDN